MLARFSSQQLAQFDQGSVRYPTLHGAAPTCIAKTSSVDPAIFAVVINATSLGLNGQGPLPGEVARVSATSLVGDVVMVPERTPLLQAAQARGVGIVYGHTKEC